MPAPARTRSSPVSRVTDVFSPFSTPKPLSATGLGPFSLAMRALPAGRPRAPALFYTHPQKQRSPFFNPLTSPFLRHSRSRTTESPPFFQPSNLPALAPLSLSAFIGERPPALPAGLAFSLAPSRYRTFKPHSEDRCRSPGPRGLAAAAHAAVGLRLATCDAPSRLLQQIT